MTILNLFRTIFIISAIILILLYMLRFVLYITLLEKVILCQTAQT